MYQFYLKIGKINENVNIIFISPETSTSYSDVALNKCDAGQGSVFYVWSFSRFNMSRCQKTVSETKCYLSTKIERLAYFSTLTTA